ncbi:MAG: amino acid ABC transporter permease [Coriobacteriaceae bacterium]|nr:amino acid ABC transporter permease [Coriobacteriaceae bacterium]
MRDRLPIAAVLVCIAAILVVGACTVQADALEVVRWSARSNQDGGNNIMGGTPTRLTFQGQSDPRESITELVLQLPEGSSFPVEEVGVTVLAGLERLDVESRVELQGPVGVKIAFPQGTPEGALVMIEVNSLSFPGDGGSYGFAGSYTTLTGKTEGLSASPSAEIEPITVIGLTAVEQMASWLGQQSWVQAWNSNKFLHLFLDPQIAVISAPVVFEGWLLALALVVVSFPLAIPLGLAWSFLRMSKNRLLRGIGSLYINIVRGTPLFLQIYIAFFGLPLLGITLDNFTLGICVLMMNSAAYLAEIFRAGIQSINKGQFEAARSLGMSGPQTMFSVIIPQTIRRVIPTMTSEFILMYKDTSLLAAVGVSEIMMFSKTITAATGNVTPYIVAAGFYLVVTLPLTKFINTVEERMAERQAGTVKKRNSGKLRGFFASKPKALKVFGTTLVETKPQSTMPQVLPTEEAANGAAAEVSAPSGLAEEEGEATEVLLKGTNEEESYARE